MVHAGELRLPVQMVAYLATGLVVMVGVSLLTPRVADARLEKLYRALYTPVADDEAAPAAPFAVPVGSTTAPTAKIIDHPDLELRYPSGVGIAGFAVLCVCVVALIAGVYVLAGA